MKVGAQSQVSLDRPLTVPLRRGRNHLYAATVSAHPVGADRPSGEKLWTSFQRFR